jgi:hypothetical protein
VRCGAPNFCVDPSKMTHIFNVVMQLYTANLLAIQ